MAEPFIPAHPPRRDKPGFWLGGFFGERSRNAVHGYTHQAFEVWNLRARVFQLNVFFPRHPDMIEHVLLTNAANYNKPDLVKRVLYPMIGQGLIMADGDLWRSQRKLVAPNFAPGAVAGLTATMVNAVEREMAHWPQSGRIDIAEAATHTTMRIITDALFSGDPRLLSDEAARHITAALESVGSVRLSAILGIPAFPSPTVRRGQKGRKYLRRTLGDIVAERGPEGGDDFLGGMIRDFHQRFDREDAVALATDNAATFYVAGHETTANALSWSIYLLSNVPDVQERARAEAIAALDGEAATLPERLPYLRQVVDEALRLYPPAPRFDRQAVAEDDLMGERVKPGDIVSIWPWLIHRHKKLWDNPDAFDPDRFAPGTEAKRHRFQYIPFGGGPRICVGARFAVVEALVILAHWLANRRFTPVEDHKIELYGAVTLRPRGGLPVNIAPL